MTPTLQEAEIEHCQFYQTAYRKNIDVSCSHIKHISMWFLFSAISEEKHYFVQCMCNAIGFGKIILYL